MVETRLKQAAALSLLVGSTACASAYLPVDARGARTAAPPARASESPAPTPSAKLGGQTDFQVKPDACGATALAYMIGRPRVELPVPADLSRRRVVCSTCSVAGPPQSDRQTILYDSASQRIVAVTCG